MYTHFGSISNSYTIVLPCPLRVSRLLKTVWQLTNNGVCSQVSSSEEGGKGSDRGAHIETERGEREWEREIEEIERERERVRVSERERERREREREREIERERETRERKSKKEWER
jgi:hypothetical protein